MLEFSSDMLIIIIYYVMLFSAGRPTNRNRFKLSKGVVNITPIF